MLGYVETVGTFKMIPVSYPILSYDGNVSCFDIAIGATGNGVPPVGTGKVYYIMHTNICVISLVETMSRDIC